MADMKLPPGIRPRGPSAFQVSASYKGQRRTGTARTLEEAEKLQAKLRSDLMNAEEEPTAGAKPGSAPAWRLQSAYQRACEVAWAGTSAERSSTRNAREAMAYFGRDTRLDQITTDWIDQWVGELIERGNGNGTINRKLSALSKMLRVAHTRQGLDAMPHMPFRSEKGNSRIRYLSEREEEELLATTRHFGFGHIADVWIVLMDTGLRPSELLKLESRDVDVKSARPSVTTWETKTDDPRTVPLTRRATAIIRERLVGAAPTAKLFPETYGQLRQRWDLVRQHMGLQADKQFVIYVLRHTCASRLTQRGVPLHVIMEWLGHKSISQTLTYAKLAPANLHNAVSALEPQEAQAEAAE